MKKCLARLPNYSKTVEVDARDIGKFLGCNFYCIYCNVQMQYYIDPSNPENNYFHSNLHENFCRGAKKNPDNEKVAAIGRMLAKKDPYFDEVIAGSKNDVVGNMESSVKDSSDEKSTNKNECDNTISVDFKKKGYDQVIYAKDLFQLLHRKDLDEIIEGNYRVGDIILDDRTIGFARAQENITGLHLAVCTRFCADSSFVIRDGYLIFKDAYSNANDKDALFFLVKMEQLYIHTKVRGAVIGDQVNNIEKVPARYFAIFGEMTLDKYNVYHKVYIFEPLQYHLFGYFKYLDKY